MRASFGGLPVIMLIFVVSTSLSAVKKSHQSDYVYYSDCYCRFGYPALTPVSRKSIAEIRVGDARDCARHRLGQSSWGEILIEPTVADRA